MRIKWPLRYLVFLLGSGVFIGPIAQAEPHGDRARAGFDGLSRELSTCSAYFSLLASIVETSQRLPGNAGIARRIKGTSQVMLTHSINVANYIGLGDDVVMARVQQALKQMVDTVNGDPANSLEVMRAKYGRPCDALLQSAPARFADLVDEYGEEF